MTLPSSMASRIRAGGVSGSAVINPDTILAQTEPSPEDTGRSESEIMEDIIADVAEARRERRVRRT